ncbi:hypothetical protein [Nocardia aurantia]|uniref:hypothetical protein n=1 Tax=Nocardia aurantia TaxID=2585199 RepID=UPI001297B9F8|nr:hypothetical protein [Nocardia aurantia]
MTQEQSSTDRLHRVTHRIPGVPAHVEREPGHQGGIRHGLSLPAAHGHSGRGRWNHSAGRPPRVLARWQGRIAAFFGQDL